MKFRDLRADEVECRVATCKSTGCSLLLYKDARCDMNILDETVGIMGWKRHHELINGNLFCTVELYDPEKGEWISKQDVGTESYTEREKGQASDSFKRACFNLGIGRELYTAPFIWIPNGAVKMIKQGDRYTTYDKFKVSEMEVIGKKITSLTINGEKSNEIVFKWSEKQNDTSSQKITDVKQRALLDFCDENGLDINKILESYHLKEICDITERQHLAIIKYGNQYKDKWGVS